MLQQHGSWDLTRRWSLLMFFSSSFLFVSGSGTTKTKLGSENVELMVFDRLESGRSVSFSCHVFSSSEMGSFEAGGSRVKIVATEAKTDKK